MASREKNAKLFEKIMARAGLSIDNPKWHAKKLHADGFIPLSIDVLVSDDSSTRFALAHNTINNGDVMADPDMEVVYTRTMSGISVLRAETYQNSWVGFYQSVNAEMSLADREKLSGQLDDFLAIWLNNIWEQGHK